VILIIGARSATGTELVRLLRAAGEPLRILTRSTEPADPDSVPGNLAHPDSLKQAMDGVDKVFLLCSAAHDELAWHRNAIDAANGAGVSHLVRSSILGADPAVPARFLRHHGQADEYLRASGVPHTILRPNMYLHNVTRVWPQSIGPDGNYYAPAGDARISMTDARDIAAVAARILTRDSATGAAYDVTGPQALNHAEACQQLGAHLGRPVRYVPGGDDTAHAAMLAAGLQRWLADALIELYQDYRRSGTDGYAAQIHDTVPSITGHLARSLDQALAHTP
jgi:uncharacterized protein YbjT (DUF2867 family)